MASQLSAAATVPQFHGLRSYSSPRSMVTLPSMRTCRKRSQGIRCDYIGSSTNLVRSHMHHACHYHHYRTHAGTVIYFE